MATIKVYNMQGSEVGTMELNDNVFGVEYKEAVIKESLRILKVYGLKGFNENWCDGDDVFPLNSLLSAMGTECTQTTEKWVVKSDIISELELLLLHLKS